MHPVGRAGRRAACEIVMEEVGLGFRAMKDLDLVILVEALDAAFGARFWAFVEAVGYQQRKRSGGGREFYRFQKPADPRFLATLELFSRAPDAITPSEGSALIRGSHRCRRTDCRARSTRSGASGSSFFLAPGGHR